MSLFITPDPPPSLFRASWWHPEGKTPGGRRHRLGGGGGQRPSGGPRAFGKAQERHTQDLLQVWQDHDRVLSRCRWHDQRVRPQMFSSVFFCASVLIQGGFPDLKQRVFVLFFSNCFFLLVTVTSSWSMLLLLKPSKQSRTQMDTNSTSNTRLGSTSSLTLTSEYGVPPSKCIVQVLLARLGIQVNNRPFVLFFLDTWTSAMNGKLQQSSLSKTL